MRICVPAGLPTRAEVWAHVRGDLSRCLKAGFILFQLTTTFAGAALAEPQVLIRMDFYRAQMPDVHPLLDARFLAPQLILGPGPVQEANQGSFGKIVAAGLGSDGPDSVNGITGGRILSSDVLRREAPGASLEPRKSEPFGLLKTMPASYAGTMFGIGWLLLLVSLVLGYKGRHTTPYSANDPATWDPKERRPLAAIVFQPHSDC